VYLTQIKIDATESVRNPKVKLCPLWLSSSPKKGSKNLTWLMFLLIQKAGRKPVDTTTQ